MYQLSDERTFLMIPDITMIFTDLSEYGGKSEVKENILYDIQGEVVTHLPLEYLNIKESPDKEYFLAVSLEENGGSEHLYFYSSNGTMLAQQEIPGYATITFSETGKFVEVFDDITGAIIIFSKTGEIVFQKNYVELTHDNSTRLSQVFVSENDRHLLIATDLALYFYTLNEEFLWKQPTLGVNNCYFFNQQESIAVKVIDRELNQMGAIDCYNLQVRSLATGEVLDEIRGISEEIISDDSHLLLKKEGQYYEYMLRSQ